MWSLKKKQSKSDILYMLEPLWNKIIDFLDVPVVQCDDPAVKNFSLDDDANNDHK